MHRVTCRRIKRGVALNGGGPDGGKRNMSYLYSSVDDICSESLNIVFKFLQFVVDSLHIGSVHLLMQVGLKSLKAKWIHGTFESFASRNLLHCPLQIIKNQGKQVKPGVTKSSWTGRGMAIQLNAALTDFRGPTIFFCYRWTSVIANKGKKRN